MSTYISSGYLKEDIYVSSKKYKRGTRVRIVSRDGLKNELVWVEFKSGKRLLIDCFDVSNSVLGSVISKGKLGVLLISVSLVVLLVMYLFYQCRS